MTTWNPGDHPRANQKGAPGPGGRFVATDHDEADVSIAPALDAAGTGRAPKPGDSSQLSVAKFDFPLETVEHVIRVAGFDGLAAEVAKASDHSQVARIVGRAWGALEKRLDTDNARFLTGFLRTFKPSAPERVVPEISRRLNPGDVDRLRYNLRYAHLKSSRGTGWEPEENGDYTLNLAKRAFPKELILKALQTGCPFAGPHINVGLSFDPDEAAAFLREDLRDMSAEWDGAPEDLYFLEDFASTFRANR